MLLRGALRPCRSARRHAVPTAHRTTAVPARPSSTSGRARTVPTPTPFIPDVAALLSVIGRNMSAHASKFPSWAALFGMSSGQMRTLGVEPARQRRYLLYWLARFRCGNFGVGGDATHVSSDGVALLQAVEVPVVSPQAVLDAGDAAAAATAKTPRHTVYGPRLARATASHTPGTHKFVVNVPPGCNSASTTSPAIAAALPLHRVQPVRGMHVHGARNIAGPFVEYIKGTGMAGARLCRREGIWEVRLGHKVDGGERRRAEVRSKRRAAENKERQR